MNTSRFSNVIHAEIGDRWPEMLEGAYLESFFSKLETLDPSGFRNIRFLIANKNTRFGPLQPPFFGQDVVLIWLSDEDASIPPADFCRNFKLILKSYWPLREGIRNVLPFPLCGENEVVRTQPLPWSGRNKNVFFSGNLNANRVDFFRQFNALRNLPPWDLPFYWSRRIYWEVLLRWPAPFRRDFSSFYPNSVIRFTQAFKSGMAPQDYARSLAECKIAICPPGFSSAETIRHFEAMRLGCVVVSAPLPPSSFYEGSPITIIPNWRSLGRCLFNLLKEDSEVLRKRGEATLQWWDSRASPPAIANIVFRHLRCG